MLSKYGVYGKYILGNIDFAIFRNKKLVFLGNFKTSFKIAHIFKIFSRYNDLSITLNYITNAEDAFDGKFLND